MLEANIDEIRAAAGSAVGITATGRMTGPLVVELDKFTTGLISQPLTHLFQCRFKSTFRAYFKVD